MAKRKNRPKRNRQPLSFPKRPDQLEELRAKLERFREQLKSSPDIDEPPGWFTNAITLEQIKATRPATIYYAARTCWWTHDPSHLFKAPGIGIPVDPRGSPLFQTDDVDGFLSTAEIMPEYYGRHGLRAFVAAHHLNCVVHPNLPRPTSFAGWDAYNDILDRYDADQGGD